MHSSKQRNNPFLHWLAIWLLIVILSVALLGGAGTPPSLFVRGAHAAPQAETATGEIFINEVAWGGTAADSNDEWIELYNPGTSDVNLSGWTLIAIDNNPSITLDGTIPAGGYYLLERDQAATDIIADQLYSGTLENTNGETLELRAPDPERSLVDTANKNGGGWPGGSGSPGYASMERISHILDIDKNWGSNDGITVNGLDASNTPLRGTPKQQNSIFAPPPPQPPIEILINEVAWAGTIAFVGDEWIELHNPGLPGINDVVLDGWRLEAADGDPTIVFPDPTPSIADYVIVGGEYFLLERYDDNVVFDANANLIYASGLLADNGEVLYLMKPDRTIVDTANSDSGAWPAGSSTTTGSMERMGVLHDFPLSWVTNVNKSSWTNHDAAGNLINGTPGRKNWGFDVAHTPTPTFTVTPSPTSTPTHTNTPAPGQPLSIVINEVAWAGTKASSNDEWIELYNPTSLPINLSNWRLSSSDDNLNISKEFDAVILQAGDYLLLERTDDSTTDVSADIFYSGSLSNSGAILRLYDSNGFLIDSANADGGAWPAGIANTYSSMQRSVIATDSDRVWVTYEHGKDSGPKARDADGNEIMGTPGRANVPINVTATPASGSTVSPVPGIALSIVINEVAWNGTKASTDDEWIELYNPTSRAINLTNWSLRSSDGSPEIKADFKDIVLGPNKYLLLERTDEDATDVPADIIYSGSLTNTGETLRLYDANNFLIDTANGNGDAWPAGIASTYSSMQRSVIAADSDRVWVSYEASKDTGTKAKDAGGNEILGTPGRENRPINVTATSTPIGTAQAGSNATAIPQFPPILAISEFLPRPGYDWNNDGQVDVFDEFVEILNAGQGEVELSAYRLDDEDNSGSAPFTLPRLTLQPGERAVFFASQTGLLLGDAGDTLRLLKGDMVVDAYTYKAARTPDQSWCRLPDRMGYWHAPCFPTPDRPNTLTGVVPPARGPLGGYQPAVCLLPDTAPQGFVYAECQTGGSGIWNRQHWDSADAARRFSLGEGQKWETVFE